MTSSMLFTIARRAAGLFTLAGAGLVLAQAPAAGQTVGSEITQQSVEGAAGKTYYACYVQGSGTVYRIREPNTPAKCGSTGKTAHIEFSWTDGGAGNGNGGEGGVTAHGQLSGLADDDHLQYLRADGARALTGILNMGGFRLTGLAEASQPGDAVRFEQAVKVGDAAAGDLSGSFPTAVVTGLQGRSLSDAVPANGQFLGWNAAQNKWEPKTAPAGGEGGASAHAQLTGLDADDHAQYLLAQGVRQSLAGFAVTSGMPENSAAAPVSGAGSRLMWYGGKGALRAGLAVGSEWEGVNVGLVSMAGGMESRARGDGAFAYGYKVDASGDAAVAMGISSAASGTSSLAIGTRAKATQRWATALGYETTASGDGAVALGGASTASGNLSTALGGETLASGHAATAMGVKTHASGSAATTMGNETRALGAAALAIGNKTNAIGDNAFAGGSDSGAGGMNAFAFGKWVGAHGEASFAVGTAAMATVPHSVAIGTNVQALGEKSIAMGTLTDALGAGSVALGRHSVASGTNSMALGNWASTNGMGGAIVIGDNFYNESVKAAQNNQFVVRAQRFWFGHTNNVTATTGRLIETSTGAYLSGGGTWTNSSDVARKHLFEGVSTEDVLEKIERLPISSWSYRDDETTVRHIGPTAQDFHAAFRLGDTDKAIATVDADGVSLAGIQALAARNRALEQRVAALEAQLARLMETHTPR